eukprot:UN3752
MHELSNPQHQLARPPLREQLPHQSPPSVQYRRGLIKFNPSMLPTSPMRSQTEIAMRLNCLGILEPMCLLMEPKIRPPPIITRKVPRGGSKGTHWRIRKIPARASRPKEEGGGGG